MRICSRIFFCAVANCIGCFAFSQEPAIGFSREILSPLELKLNKPSYDLHPGLQPAARGLEKEFYILSDSSFAVQKYNSTIELSALGEISGGFQFADNAAPLAMGGVGAMVDWHNEEKWSASLGYEFFQTFAENVYARIADSLHVIPGEIGRAHV